MLDGRLYDWGIRGQEATLLQIPQLPYGDVLAQLPIRERTPCRLAAGTSDKNIHRFDLVANTLEDTFNSGMLCHIPLLLLETNEND